MKDIASVNQQVAGPTTRLDRDRTGPVARRQTATPTREPQTDSVEISAAASQYDPRVEAARATAARIANIQSQIAAGTYLTPDKIDVAVDRLFAELMAEPIPENPSEIV